MTNPFNEYILQSLKQSTEHWSEIYGEPMKIDDSDREDLFVNKIPIYLPVTQEMLCDANLCECTVHFIPPIPKRTLWKRFKVRAYSVSRMRLRLVDKDEWKTFNEGDWE